MMMINLWIHDSPYGDHTDNCDADDDDVYDDDDDDDDDDDE